MRPTATWGTAATKEVDGMCDYSLHTQTTRLAVEGEDLVTHRFPGGSMGMACPADLAQNKPVETCPGRNFWSWTTVKNWFRTMNTPIRPVPAVCIPPGARLFVMDIPKSMQQELGVGEAEEVTFVQISANVHTYRDAVKFANGRQVLLQALRDGQRVHILPLGAEETDAPAALESQSEDTPQYWRR